MKEKLPPLIDFVHVIIIIIIINNIIDNINILLKRNSILQSLVALSIVRPLNCRAISGGFTFIYAVITKR